VQVLVEGNMCVVLGAAQLAGGVFGLVGSWECTREAAVGLRNVQLWLLLVADRHSIHVEFPFCC
jgi:hypothetical protein